MKKIVMFFCVIFLIFPLMVKANIMCNDGTESPSCKDCHQGCCSHHGGCANNYYYDDYDEDEYYEEDDDEYYEEDDDEYYDEYEDEYYEEDDEESDNSTGIYVAVLFSGAMMLLILLRIK